MKTDKIKCNECQWFGHRLDMLKAPSPFEQGVEVTGCPSCKAVSSMVQVCYVDGCWDLATCGFPLDVEAGIKYVRTCGEHYRNGVIVAPASK